MIYLGVGIKHLIKTRVVQHALAGVSSLFAWQLDMVIYITLENKALKLQKLVAKRSHSILSKYMILCWTTSITVLSLLCPIKHGSTTLDQFA